MIKIPTLLFNDECGVCRFIASWVKKSAKTKSGNISVIVQPIGEDPKALELLKPGLSIWDAYATIHLLMPDGSIKIGGEAVAEVFRDLPKTHWLAKIFSLQLFGIKPFQKLLNLSYAILADIRPIFGCESCGAPKFWMRPFAFLVKKTKSITQHSTAISATK